MTKSNPENEATRIMVEHFCYNIFRLKQVHYMFLELFNKERTQSLMEKTAYAFFIDLNKILIDYFLLEVAKLTDPATSIGGKYENFTVANLIETVEWPPECLREIKELNKTVISFRKYIQPARNKLIAHYDKSTVVSGEVLGGFPEGEEVEMLAALEKMCNEFHKAAFGEIYGDMVPCHSGDVTDLNNTLRKAIAFDKLFSASKGDDLVRLDKLLDEVDSS